MVVTSLFICFCIHTRTYAHGCTHPSTKKRMEFSQVERHRFLIPTCKGSNPFTPNISHSNSLLKLALRTRKTPLRSLSLLEEFLWKKRSLKLLRRGMGNSKSVSGKEHSWKALLKTVWNKMRPMHDMFHAKHIHT